MSNNSESGTNESTQKDFAKLAESKDFKRFLSIQQATNQIPSEIDLKKLSDEDQAKLTLDFESWIEAGKPSAEAPKTKKKIEKVLRVYRRKVYGKQKLTYVVEGKSTQEGIEMIPEYRKVEVDGEMVEDKSMVVSTTRKYTIDYTEKKAKELVARCEKDAIEPQLHIILGNHNIPIRNKANFFADFDEVIQKVNRKELV